MPTRPAIDRPPARGSFEGLQLRLLGAPALHPVDRAAPALLPFAPERRFQLLAYLAHQRDWVGRDRLAVLFWPEHDAPSARSNLRKVLFRMKAIESLPPPDEHNGALRWPVATDIQAFEQAAAAGDAEAALAHWHGEPWQGLDGEGATGFQQWLAFERQRLRSRWRALLLGLAGNNAEDAGTADRAAAAARLLLAHDALDEEALRLLLQCELRAGRRLAARQAFHDFEAALRDTLGLEPAAATRALLETPTPTPASPATPPQPAGLQAKRPADTDPAFIGRQAELQDLQAGLRQPGSRWITISGPGGIGKTAFAQQALHGLADGYADGALVVALEDLTETAPACARVAERVAAHLGLALSGHEDALTQVAQALRTRRLLLLLDNLEQLRPAASAVHAALANCTGVQVLATSRERLGLAGEQVLALPGLPWPAAEDADRAEAFDAVRLFRRRALASQPRFRLDTERDAVVALCSLVEGHPLALQLAAVWTRHFSVSDILRDLAAGGEMLAAIDPGAGAEAAAGGRHRSIHTTIEHSWQRLVEAERQLLLRLAIFRGGFTLDAARLVAGASLATLAALIDKSLLRQDSERHGPARFSLHALVQQFAAARQPAADALACRDAHQRFYLAWLARFPRGRWAEQPAFYAQLDPDIENLRAAWGQAIAQGEREALAQATVGLASYFHARSRWDDGASWLAAAEPVLQADAFALAQLHCSWALIELNRSNHARAAELARLSLRITRRRGDVRLVRAGLFLLGQSLVAQGHHAAAFRCYQESLAQARAQGDGQGAVMNLHMLSQVAAQDERYEEAIALAQQSLDEQAPLGLLNTETLTDLAHAQRLAGQLPQAMQTFARAQARLDANSRGTEHTYCAYHHALARLAMGDAAGAEALAQQATEGLALGGQPVFAIGIGLLRARLALRRQQAEEAAALIRDAAAQARARQLPPWQLAAVVGQAELLQHTGHPHEAAALLALALAHPATPHEERHRAADLARELPAPAQPQGDVAQQLATALDRLLLR